MLDVRRPWPPTQSFGDGSFLWVLHPESPEKGLEAGMHPAIVAAAWHRYRCLQFRLSHPFVALQLALEPWAAGDLGPRLHSHVNTWSCSQH